MPKDIRGLLIAALCCWRFVTSDIVDDVDGVVVDMTHTFDNTTLYWGLSDIFELFILKRGMSTRGYWYESNKYSAPEHGGTHIDAPAHFVKGAQRLDQIPLDRLIGRAICMDFTRQAAGDPDFQIRAQHLKNWEETNGRLPPRSILLLYTGWTHKWPNATQIFGTETPKNTSTYHFPGLHEDGARWLIDERPQVTAVGIDTPSIDYGQSVTFPSHQLLYAKNVPGFENVANMHMIPPTNATVFAISMKIGEGSGGPLRIFAIIPRRDPMPSRASYRDFSLSYDLLFAISPLFYSYINSNTL